MLTIDAQVHAYERNHPGRPWADVLPGPPEVTGDQLVAAMDAVGVDAALLVSVYTMYHFDPSYALEVYRNHPTRFALIKPLNANDPGVGETVADWAKTDGAVAVRIMLTRGFSEDPADPGINRVLAAAARHGLPVNLACSGRLDQVDELARRNPDTQIVIDHLGLKQPYAPPIPPDGWADLPKLLKIAGRPNVAVKITGACTLAQQPFPYPDIWEPVGRIIDAYGLSRCMWGTDWTRAVGVLSYEQGVEAFRATDRLSASDKEALMGGTVQRIYKWTPPAR